MGVSGWGSQGGAQGGATHLEDLDVGRAVGAVAAAVPLQVLEPLQVWLGVAVDFTVQLHVAAQPRRGVGRKSGLQDGPVGGALWVWEDILFLAFLEYFIDLFY